MPNESIQTFGDCDNDRRRICGFGKRWSPELNGKVQYPGQGTVQSAAVVIPGGGLIGSGVIVWLSASGGGPLSVGQQPWSSYSEWLELVASGIVLDCQFQSQRNSLILGNRVTAEAYQPHQEQVRSAGLSLSPMISTCHEEGEKSHLRCELQSIQGHISSWMPL